MHPFLVCLVITLVVCARCSSGALIEIMCDINGYSIPAAVDTGSEITVMSTACAKRCQILNSVDTKLSGRVKGIGSSGEVIGAIKRQNFRIGPINFNNKLEVLRNSHRDLIIGLDVLERFNGVINLGKKTVRFDVQGNLIDVPILQFGRPKRAGSTPITVQELSGGFYESEVACGEEPGVNCEEIEERVSMEGV
jgi:hypothetical protein